MVKKTKKIKKEIVSEENMPGNYLSLGDLVLYSSTENMVSLLNYAVSIIQSKDLKQYLQHYFENKQRRGY